MIRDMHTLKEHGIDVSTPYGKEMAQKAIDMGEVISKHINGSHDIKALAVCLANDHPTLQYHFFLIVIRFIEIMANKKYFDVRNEFAVRICRKMWDAIKDDV